MSVFILSLTAIAFSATSVATILPFAEHTIGEFIPSTFPFGYIDGPVPQTQSCAALFDDFDASTFTLSPWSCALSSLLYSKTEVENNPAGCKVS